MTAGPELFARFAYPPNELGYCGPPDVEWSDGALRSGDTADVIHAIRQFEGAWPYLELIGGVHDLDPLDVRVVEAYWVGNELLDHIDLLTWGNSVGDRFKPRAGTRFGSLEASVAGGLPNHAFHVFCVYPWVGMLKAGSGGPALEVIDSCRIRWGSVVVADAGSAIVASAPITWDGRLLAIGERRHETVRVPAALTGLAPGAEVAVHWDHVCDILDPRRRARLIAETDRHLALANANPLEFSQSS